MSPKRTQHCAPLWVWPASYISLRSSRVRLCTTKDSNPHRFILGIAGAKSLQVQLTHKPHSQRTTDAKMTKWRKQRKLQQLFARHYQQRRSMDQYVSELFLELFKLLNVCVPLSFQCTQFLLKLSASQLRLLSNFTMLLCLSLQLSTLHLQPATFTIFSVRDGTTLLPLTNNVEYIDCGQALAFSNNSPQKFPFQAPSNKLFIGTHKSTSQMTSTAFSRVCRVHQRVQHRDRHTNRPRNFSAMQTLHIKLIPIIHHNAATSISMQRLSVPWRD